MAIDPTSSYGNLFSLADRAIDQLGQMGDALSVLEANGDEPAIKKLMIKMKKKEHMVDMFTEADNIIDTSPYKSLAKKMQAWSRLN